MKLVKFWATLTGIGVATAFVLGLILASHPPAWAWLIVILGCVGVLYIARVIQRETAWLRCEFGGHWVAAFEKYDETGYCPRCKEAIASRAPESHGPGMQSCDDTLQQRLSRIEDALLRLEHTLGTTPEEAI